ncbi:MAG: MarR family transcriptional regulator [Bacilli bacterium]|nr:MarR family transcriptional regulator [Bacilli bacterium]
MPKTEYDYLITKYHHRFLDEHFKELEISRAEAPYLHRISKAGKMKMNDLIAELPFHKSHTTRAINQLEKDGYIIKETNPDDKRGYLLSVTQKGIELKDKVHKIFTDWDDLIDTVITDEDRMVLTNLTKKMYHLLREYYGEEDMINEIDV